ncbi:rfaE bifunctional protein, domain II [Tistlia consotensis]|uniref:RfaE bifunctional protein, domain II n=1 Tax=Tistlia consotensis USBA 355 TaxID=560819 RepID=A0A1Y6B907_9PROT|nr:PfkB family carbohydrate kinase [Tistlia consotensis]SME99161.1 rfaE bifunctional protein, domain II [Tistlia consotensis USBA 355]SNR77322.1 rfaE bifunctional protein, domain II [Tistlia consotensis]
MAISSKIVSLETLSRLSQEARARGEAVVQCHGVFDVLHVGHLRHLEAARRHGTMLVVTITADRFVNKGPGRPIFNNDLRCEMLAALDVVSYVAVNNNGNAVPAIEAVKPTVFAKGGEYVDPKDDVTGQIVVEKATVERFGGRIEFTHDLTFSSSSLINSAFDVYSPALNVYLRTARERGLMTELSGVVEAIGKLKVLFVGDMIVDEYAYVRPMGKSAKDNIIATLYQGDECFAGGVVAAANNMAEMCGSVDVLTMLGDQRSYETVIRESLRPNINLQLTRRADAPTTRKCRYVDPNYTRKLFEVYYMDDTPLPSAEQAAFDGLLKEQIADYDVVVVTDFGHGLIADSTRRVLEEGARFLAVNTQTNSANIGYNLINNYRRADLVCIDAPEARLATRERYAPLEQVIRERLTGLIDCGRFIVTNGANGCYTYEPAEQRLSHVPAFVTEVVDTVGAGDAFLSVASPVASLGVPLEYAGFMGNAVGGIKVGIVGHRRSIGKAEVVKFITALLK